MDGKHERLQFQTTRWSVVLAAGRESSPDSQSALTELCERYWYPLYAYVRRQGNQPQDAEDLTQGFFTLFLSRNDLQTVSPERGKFRSFLLACLKNFLANERQSARAQKRGGGRVIQSLDSQTAEERYRLEPADELTPDKVFDRQWAMLLLEQTLAKLRDEFSGAGKVKMFERLKPFLTGEKAEQSQAEIAVALDMTEDAVKAAVYRLRRRFRRQLCDLIAETVAEPDAVEAEMNDLFAALQT